MNTVLMSLGDMPAGEGIGGVISSALLAGGTLALIYGVLVVIDRYHKKHSSGESRSDDTTQEQPVSRTFPQVLDEQIEKSKDKDGRA